jgi:hypothetical protein
MYMNSSSVPRIAVLTWFTSAAIALLTNGVAGAADQAPPQGAAISLSEPYTVRSGGARDATVAFDSGSGRAYIAWAQEVPPTAKAKKAQHTEQRLVVLLARSADGGKTFDEPSTVSVPTDRVTTAAVSAAKVQVGPKGEVYVMYPHQDPTFKILGMNVREQVRFVRSLDGARTFEAPIEIGSIASEGVATSLGMINLFASPDGTLYASWLDTRATFAYAARHHEWPGLRQYSSQLRVARSVDGGRGFERSVIAAAPTCVCCGTHVAQGSAGPVYASTRGIEWPDPGEEAESVRDIIVAHSDDHGLTWSAAGKIHDDGFRINTCPDVTAGLAVDSSQRLHAAWYTGSEKGPGMYYAISSDQGRSFTAPVPLLPEGSTPYGGVKLALDSQDNAWIALESRQDDSTTIHLLRIGHDGTVSRAPPWTGRSPDLARLGDGVIVTWNDGHGSDEESAGGLYSRIAHVETP